MALSDLDNHLSAEQRSTAQISREYTIPLSGSTAGQVDMPAAIKSAQIRVDGAEIELWPSYDNGSTDVLAGVNDNTTIRSEGSDYTSNRTNAAAEKTLKTIKDGGVFLEAQNAEFNKINAVIKSGSGSATVYVYPGGGL